MRKVYNVINLLLLFNLFIWHEARGQFAQQYIIHAPNAAELGKYGQVPVNPFNGLANVSIPIFNYAYKELSVPITLQYHGGGIRADEYPTWVGLGWNLQAGGAITRIVNGLPDEITTRDLNDNQSAGTYSYPETQEYGYLYRGKDLENANWSTTSTINTYLDPTSMQLGLMPYDAEPDEYLFNVGNLSGSFFMYFGADGTLKVKVKSKGSEYITVSPTITQTPTQLPIFQNLGLSGPQVTTLVVNRMVLTFTITDPNGIKYYFGGSVSAIDFNSTPSVNKVKTIPTAWYLTKIESPNNYYITLEYKKQGDVFIKRRNKSILCTYIPESTTGECVGNNIADEYSFSVQHPSYLVAVKSPEGEIMRFFSSKAEQLGFDWADRYHEDPLSQFSIRGQWEQAWMNGSYWLKLDSMQIANRGVTKFTFSNTATQRLRLAKLTQVSGTQQISTYSFSYNAQFLPAYNAKRTDNWGYYNNKNYDGVNFDNMYTYRSPNLTYAQAESLQKIVYPTGGETSFFYQLHDYGQVATQYPFGLSQASGSAGGIRIYKIATKISASAAADSIIYEYKNENNTSSGILSGIPKYKVSGRQYVDLKAKQTGFLFGIWSNMQFEHRFALQSENLLNPLSSTNGNHVTYSRVVEKRYGKGYTVYTYTNHNNYPDQEPVNVVNNIDSAVLYNPFTSRELERGLLTSETQYNQNNQAVFRKAYSYNSTAERYNDYIRVIQNTLFKGYSPLYFIRSTAYKIYTFYPYLLSETLTEYQNGAATRITTTNYEHNANYRLLTKKTTTNSKQQSFYTTYSYPVDSLSKTIYTNMKNKNIVNKILKETTVDNGQSVSNITSYTTLFNGLYTPSIIQTKKGNLPVETTMNIKSVDAYNNPLEIQRPGGPTEVLLWGYNGQYPVAKISNSTYIAASNLVNLTMLKEAYDYYEGDIRAELNKLRTGLPNALVTTYTYLPNLGLASETDASGKTTYYKYDSLGRLWYIKDHDGKIIQSYQYKYKN